MSYIAAFDGQIYTFNPTLGGAVTPFTASVGTARDVAISGSTGYIAAQNGQIYTFNPTLGGAVTPFTASVGTAFGVAISGSTGYIAAQNGQIYTFNPTLGGAVTPFTASVGIALGVAIGPFTPSTPLASISTTGLTSNSLNLATYLNNNAPASIRLLFNSSTNLNRALKSASPVRNAITTFMGQIGQLSFEQLLDHHWQRRSRMAHPSEISSRLDPDPLLASNRIPFFKKKKKDPPFCRRFSPWIGVFGEYANLQAAAQTPSVQSGSGGVIAAWDYYYGDLRLHSVGVGAAYAHTHLHQDQSAGHADINQGALTLYGTWTHSKWYCNSALWGGIYYNHNVRHVTISTVSGDAKSNTHGWQFTPHLEIGYHYSHVEPFIMADWVNCWESSLREQGLSGLNMGQEGRYCSLFRGEAGFRFQEMKKVSWGALLFREKLSYAYQKTFHTGTINAFLIGSPGSFTVSTLVGAQNLGVGEFEIFFAPNDPKRPYGSLAYQGEFGSRYQSHQLSATIGKEF